jgi:hypothetical protein
MGTGLRRCEEEIEQEAAREGAAVRVSASIRWEKEAQHVRTAFGNPRSRFDERGIGAGSDADRRGHRFRKDKVYRDRPSFDVLIQGKAIQRRA